MASVIPDEIDLSLVGTFAAVGVVVFTAVARIRRRFGHETDLGEAALAGAYWGGVIGLVTVVVIEAAA